MNRGVTFGHIVKERRTSLGLTQAELGRRVGCAAITIRKIEADALRPSVQIAEHLAVALNIPEAEHLAFVRLARAERDPSPLPTPQPIPAEIGQEDLSGRAIRGFELGERLGTGGYGVVYRATQTTIDRDVAVKIILPHFADQPEFIRRFEAESQLVARLEHPHIVPLYDYWREPSAAYLIMRLLRGGSLAMLLKDGPLPHDVILHLMEQLCAALHAAHRAGVIHRDLKPANILPADESVELVLVIDQFEEVFTLVEDEATRTHLLEGLVTAVLDPSSRLRVIITLRADFTHHPLRYVDFGDLVRQRSEFVLPLTLDELEETIVGPTRQAGLGLESGLVSTIIRQIGDQPGTLPLLQYALTELFERRRGRLLTLAAYQDSGGVLGALARRADKLYQGLDNPGRTAARQLFSRLVTLGEGAEDTRRRVLRNELASLTTNDTAKNPTPYALRTTEHEPISHIIDTFGRYRLLTFDHDPVTRGPTVEVAHESLFGEWEMQC